MRSSLLLAALAPALVLVLGARDADAQVAGINLGAPVYDGVVADDALKAVIASGAPHVRVNFRLDRWTSPADATKHGGRTFFEAYDAIVDAIVSHGLEVYGLLNDELGSGDAYVANALAVVEHFRDRVRVWETLNEPNDWAGGTSARYPAATFAEMHARVYDAVKAKHPGDGCWDVKLVSGPLFSFDGTSAADYLDAAIAAGRGGGTWKALRDASGADPIDGVGYHVYVAQGSDSPIADVGASGGANLDAIGSVLVQRGLGDRKIWISETGFQVPAVDEQGQADRLDATFGALGARSDVASIQWFTIADFGGQGWGLYRDAIAPANRRPAYDRFVAQARAHAPALAARLAVSLPAQITAGAKVTATITATNLGSSAWSAADQVRLGAASGCPAAWATNTWRWDAPVASDGYAASATDARRFLPPAASIAQGGSVTLEVTLTAPSQPGKARFAARMVKESVAWFGATAIADVDVVAPGPVGLPTAPPPTASTASPPNPGEPIATPRGCACTAACAPASRPAIVLAIVLSGVASRRRRAR
jgi:hypothetical protein